MRAKLLFAAFFALLAYAWAAPASAACAGGTCFWIGGTAAGAVNNTANWSLTSGGGPCTCVPTTTDAVILDSASANPMLISSALSVGTFDASGTGGTGSPYTGTITHNNAMALTINTAATKSLKFSTQLTYTTQTLNTAVVAFANTSGTATLTSSGKNFAAITVNGVGGTVSQADDLNITNVQNGTLTITNGIFTSNGHALSVGILSSNNANTRSLILGSSFKLNTNVAAATSVWVVTSTLTFTPGSTAIEIVAPTAANSGPTLGLASLTTYAGITLDASTFQSAFSLTGSGTATNLTVGSGWNVQLQAANTLTLSGNLTVTGTSGHWSGLVSPAGNAATVTVTGTCTLAFALIQNIISTNACTATNGIPFGTTTNFTTTLPTIGGGGSARVPDTVM